MRQAITIGRRHDAPTFKVIAGPELPIAEHHKRFKTMREFRDDPDFAEVELWESGRGRVRRHRFSKPTAPDVETPKPKS